MDLIKRHLLLVAAGGLATAAGAWIGWRRLKPSVAAPSMQALWAAEFKDLAGKPVAMASLRGKPAVINFWATWCEPCKDEMPDFQRLATSDIGKNLQIVGIGIDSATNMSAFAKKLGISYLLLEAGASGLDVLKAAGNKVGGLPYTMVVNARGEPVLVKLGRISEQELREAALLAQRS